MMSETETTNQGQTRGVSQVNQPFTCLFMLPDHQRSDQPCAADEIMRVACWAPCANTAPEAARKQIPIDLDCADMSDDDLDEYATVAVYPGHLFDLFQA